MKKLFCDVCKIEISKEEFKFLVSFENETHKSKRSFDLCKNCSERMFSQLVPEARNLSKLD